MLYVGRHNNGEMLDPEDGEGRGKFRGLARGTEGVAQSWSGYERCARGAGRERFASSETVRGRNVCRTKALF